MRINQKKSSLQGTKRKQWRIKMQPIQNFLMPEKKVHGY
jgi:hypothetical protein